MPSYTSISGVKDSLAEFVQLVRRIRRASATIEEEVRGDLDDIRDAERFVTATTGLEVKNLDVLEIGPGQLPRQIAYFGAHNRLTAVDTDVIPFGFDPLAYAHVLMRNGPKRALKTLARKALGFDRRYYAEICRQLSLRRVPRFSLMQMDAANLSFEVDAFDFVYSFSVFEHLPDPAAVLNEIKRVLRPGGVLLTHLHLFTSDNGSHDLRIGKNDRAGLPYWPHLRPEHSSKVRTSAYLNKIRLKQWETLFALSMPGTRFAYDRDGERHAKELLVLRGAGELVEYGNDELLTHNLLAVWKKPSK